MARDVRKWHTTCQDPRPAKIVCLDGTPPPARRLRRPAAWLRGLTAARSREVGMGAVDAVLRASHSAAVRTRSGAVRQICSRLLHLTPGAPLQKPPFGPDPALSDKSAPDFYT
jgi:hypothetical protein